MIFKCKAALLYICITFFLFFVNRFFSSCNQSYQVPASDTFIRGNMQFPTGDKLYFLSYSDTANLFLNRKSAIDSSDIDPDGNYIISLHIKSSCAFDLVYGRKKLASNLFMSPGDKIEMNFKGKSFVPYIKRSAPEAKYNTFLLQYLDSFYKNEVLKPQYYIASNYMEVNEFEKYTNMRRNQQLSFFNNFFTGDSIKPAFSNYALNTINYGIAVDRLLYLWKKRMKGHSVTPDSSYWFFKDKVFLENDKALNCPVYIHFLTFYIKEMYSQGIESGALPENKSVDVIPQVEKYKLAVKLLERPFSDVVLYDIFSFDLEELKRADGVNAINSLSFDELNSRFRKKYSIQ